MNVLLLTLAYPENEEGRNIYTDLMQEFHSRGDNVYVVCQRERRCNKPTEFKEENGITILRVKTGNITKTNIIEKVISTLFIDRIFINAIKKNLMQIKFDLLLYSTPPITFESVVKYIKRHNRCKTYLLLKDIFPQNAVDIGLMKKGSLIWRYFSAKEKKLYAISDHIGCMSDAGVKYLLKHNPEINPQKVGVCPNSIKPVPSKDGDSKDPSVWKKYGIPQDVVVFLYGGNLGTPQGIEFLLEVFNYVKNRKDIFFLIVGSGTEYDRIERFLKKDSYPNIKLIQFLPRIEYDRFLENSDVGLIFLDRRFTIPNFPSRLTSYMEYALPIIAATDVITDIKDVIQESQCGLWIESGNLKEFIKAVDSLAANPILRRQQGLNGRRYLEKYYTVARAYEIITAHFK